MMMDSMFKLPPFVRYSIHALLVFLFYIFIGSEMWYFIAIPCLCGLFWIQSLFLFPQGSRSKWVFLSICIAWILLLAHNPFISVRLSNPLSAVFFSEEMTSHVNSSNFVAFHQAISDGLLGLSIGVSQSWLLPRAYSKVWWILMTTAAYMVTGVLWAYTGSVLAPRH